MDLEIKMNVLLILQIIVLFLCYCATNVNGRPRLKRQNQYSFNVIGNNSFPCDQATTSSTTTTTSATSALKSEGLYSSKPLSLTTEDLESLMKSKRMSSDSMLTARTLKETDTFPNLLPLSTTYKDSVRQKLQSRSKGILTKAEIIRFLEYLETEQSTYSDLEGSDKIPGVSDNEVHTVRKRDTSGGSSQEYCIYRGDETSDSQFLRMCTTCATTTDLGSNYYPQYVNEASCKADDINCLVVESFDNKAPTNHGRCQPINLPLNVLRRKEGYCTIALKDGQTVIVEEWEAETRNIHVGCECTVDTNSVFRYFV